MVLPSNASGRDFPENTNSTYRVRLEQTYKFPEREFEVGISEIHLPSRWKNITEGMITIGVNRNGIRSKIDGYIRRGCYTDYRQLIAEMERVIRSMSSLQSVRIAHDDISNQFHISISSECDMIRFSSDLATAIGFEGEREYTEKSNKSSLAPDIDQGLTSVYVYLDIVEPWDVGDTRAPLLRIAKMNPPSADSKGSHIEFKNIQYVPVRGFNRDVIEVNIRRDDGSIVPFEGGKVSLTLHIRPIKR